MIVIVLTMLAATLCCEAEVIEHTSDGYIIHVNEMELSGEESLRDVIMMCPEVFTTNGRDVTEDYSIRIFDQIISIDTDEYLDKTKAKHIAELHFYKHTAYFNAFNDAQYVIDVTYRDDQPSYAEATLQASSRGSAKAFLDLSQKVKDFTIWSQVEGSLEYSAIHPEIGERMSAHSTTEAVRLGTQWTPSEKDKVNFNFSHFYDYSRIRQWELNQKFGYWAIFGSYERQLHDNGMYIYFEGLGEWSNNRITYEDEGNVYDENGPSVSSQRAPVSYILAEFSTPLGTEKLWFTAGFERGWGNTRDMIADDDKRWRYTDGYFQFEYKTSRLGLTFADRISYMPVWRHNAFTGDSFCENETHHNLVASARVNLNSKHSINAIFSRKHNAILEDDDIALLPDLGHLNGLIAFFVGTFSNIALNQLELRHTFQNKKFILMSHITNSHYHDYENKLSVGTSATYSWPWLRLVAAASFTHLKQTYESILFPTYDFNYANYFNLRLVPQFTLPHGWYLTSTMIYNSRISGFYDIDNPATFYLAMRASKRFNEHWNVYADFTNIAQQRLGNRNFAVGGTYAF